MKKDYHYTISRTDRICLIAFVIFLLSWELVKELLPSGEKSFTYIAPPSEQKRQKKQKKFNYSSNYKSNQGSTFRPKNYANASIKKFEKRYSSYQEEQEQSPPAAPLSIMTASIDEMTSMGLSRKVAYNIQKFISAGGAITSDRDLLKIYGMDSLQFTRAVPYIIYGTVPSREKDSIYLDKIFNKKTPPIQIDLNQASLKDLESLNGIGNLTAERIIKFRDKIGGFISADQLNDCYCLYPDTFEKIKDQLTISGAPSPIFINEVNLDSITHPYLTKKMTGLIKAYKKHHGSFKDEESFRKVYPPNPNWCDKILPYISFENSN